MANIFLTHQALQLGHYPISLKRRLCCQNTTRCVHTVGFTIAHRVALSLYFTLATGVKGVE